MMPTAIRTYQSGGDVTPFYQPLPMTPGGTPALPVEPANQPAPGAAGQTTPAQPPPAAVRTTPIPGVTPGAPTQQGLPPDFDDRDLEASNTAEADAFKSVASHRGDHRFLSGSMPEPLKLEDHPEYKTIQEAQDLLNQMDPKTAKRMQPQLTRLQTRVQRETDNKNKSARGDFIRQETQALSKADAQGIDPLRIPDLDTHVGNGYSTVAKTFDQQIQQGSPPDRQRAEQRLVSSPLKTMEPDQQLSAARSILSLNKAQNMSPSDAARIVVQLGTPPPRGQKGDNGLTGRGAANYIPVTSDVLGNRILKTEMGHIRVDPDTYQQIKNARLKGYKASLDYQKKLDADRAEEQKPGAVSRAIDWGIEQLK
jgi:hypothetical protein